MQTAMVVVECLQFPPRRGRIAVRAGLKRYSADWYEQIHPYL